MFFLLSCFTPAPTGIDAITVSDLQNHVAVLSSDEYLGRGTGEEGLEKAAAYIEEAFRNNDFSPYDSEQSLRVPFDLFQQDWTASSLSFLPSETSNDIVFGRDWTVFPFSDEGTLETEVVFAGYGITAPEHEYDDYDGLDVSGKVVLVMRREPNADDPNSPFNGAENTRHSYFSAKAKNAKEHGAKGMLLYTDPTHPDPETSFAIDKNFSLESNQAEETTEPFLAAHIGSNIAQIFFEDQSLETIQQQIDKNVPAKDILTKDLRVSLNIKPKDTVISSDNLVGWLQGSDPEYSDEFIVIGAHYDHLGYEANSARIYNGADDNASGTAVLLELAQAFATAEVRPKRSIVFAAFSAEEHGLLGSKVLLEQKLNADNLVFMLNLDMVGRNADKPLSIIGEGFATDVKEIVEQSNQQHALNLEYAGTQYFGASDHHYFYKAYIPFLFFFSGLHDDYHQPTDTQEKLDYERMNKIARLSYDVVHHIANAKTVPLFVKPISWMGSSLRVTENAAVVHKVRLRSQADRLGLEEGDILLSIEEQRSPPKQWLSTLEELEVAKEYTLQIQREHLSKTISIQRSPKGYIGIYPRAVSDEQRKEYDLGEEQGLLVSRVVPTGPADSAGIKTSDIILSINDEIVSPQNLDQKMNDLGAETIVTIELLQDGLPKRIQLKLATNAPR